MPWPASCRMPKKRRREEVLVVPRGDAAVVRDPGRRRTDGAVTSSRPRWKSKPMAPPLAGRTPPALRSDSGGGATPALRPLRRDHAATSGVSSPQAAPARRYLAWCAVPPARSRPAGRRRASSGSPAPRPAAVSVGRSFRASGRNDAKSCSGGLRPEPLAEHGGAGEFFDQRLRQLARVFVVPLQSGGCVVPAAAVRIGGQRAVRPTRSATRRSCGPLRRVMDHAGQSRSSAPRGTRPPAASSSARPTPTTPQFDSIIAVWRTKSHSWSYTAGRLFSILTSSSGLQAGNHSLLETCSMRKREHPAFVLPSCVPRHDGDRVKHARLDGNAGGPLICPWRIAREDAPYPLARASGYDV